MELVLDWRGVGVLLSIWLAWSGALFWVIKWLLDKTAAGIDRRFNLLEKAHADEASEWQRIDRDLMSLRAELPLHYVRREDYIRGQSVIEAKLDAVAGKIELLQIKGAQHER